MSRRRVSRIPAILLTVALLFPGPLAEAMELVVFTSERSLLVDRCDESGGLLILYLMGGGVMGIPADRVRARYAGFILPAEEEKPGALLPETLPFRELVAKYCQEYQMDWKIVAAVIQVESAFNPKAVSPKGAKGLMQLMPSVQKDEGVKDPFDPDQNLKAGIHHLKKMLEACEGDLELALAAYNAGLSRVQARNAVPEIAETKNYVAKILGIYPTL